MCGIAGVFAYGHSVPLVDQDELLRIRDAMIRRGPDGAGLWMSPDRRIALAHRRLAIIDLSEAGAQPMATADGHFRVTFNGESQLSGAQEERSKGPSSPPIRRACTYTRPWPGYVHAFVACPVALGSAQTGHFLARVRRHQPLYTGHGKTCACSKVKAV